MTAAPPARPAADVTVRHPQSKALSYLLSAPGSLGLARAYVSGELDLDGDVYRALSYLWSDALGSVTWAQRLDALRNIDPKALRWVEAPP
jgi:cyclopropane-fatty-acyl-phospholipid synthase